MPADDRTLVEIRDDLTDGEDLSLAARLIGDTLARRMRRARRLLSELDTRDDGPEHDRLSQLQRRADEVEKQLSQLSSRFSELTDAFEAELSDLADQMTDEDPSGR